MDQQPIYWVLRDETRAVKPEELVMLAIAAAILGP